MSNFKEEIIERVKLSGGWKQNHVHMDRVYTINQENFRKSQMDLTLKWDYISELKKSSTVNGMIYRMSKFIENQLSQGVTSITTFLDFDSLSEDRPFKAFSKIKEIYGKDIELRCVNQTLHGVLDKEAHRWFLIGSEVADIVGGLPGKDKGYEVEHIDIVLRRAKELNKTAHLHIGQFQKPDCFELEYLINSIEENNMQNKVAAVHCLSIACKLKEIREQVYKDAEKVGLNFIVAPKVWLDSPRTEIKVPFHNSSTPVDELINYDVKIGLSSDNVLCLMAALNDGEMYSELTTLAMICRLYDIEKLVNIATTRIN